jgi:hypothetical protein
MTTFNDLKVGDEYILTSEDDSSIKTQGRIVEVSKFNGTVRVQFDDEQAVYTWGKPTEHIHWFMEKVS